MTKNNQQSLAKAAGFFSLWGLAVSAVVVGEFAGWNQGLLEGGFGGMLIATLLIVLMYSCLCVSLAELSAAMPFTGGAYAFSRAAFGPWGGLMAGVSQIIEYQLALSTIVVAIGIGFNAALKDVFGMSIYSPVLWAVIIAIFLFLNSWDTKLFFKSAIALSVAPLLILITFWYLAIPQFSVAHLLSNGNADQVSRLLPNGLVGIAWALPFAVWFFLSIEVVSLAGEEAKTPEKTIPKTYLWAFLVLVISALATLVLNAGIPPGAGAIGSADAPLLLGFQSLLGNRLAPAVLILMILIGSIASFHSTIYAAARSIFSLARAGYMPKFLAGISTSRKTPMPSLILVGVLTFVIACGTLLFANEASAIAVLLNMSVLGAIISYIFTLFSFVILRSRYPKMHRPYLSPLGVTGAITGLIIAIFTLVLMFTNAGYRIGLFGCIIIYALSCVIYVTRIKSQAHESPEEAFAEALHTKSHAHSGVDKHLAGHAS